MATLVAPDGTAFELAEGETLVGRGERELGDPPKVNLGALSGGLTVSRQHARLRQDNEQWFVEAERQVYLNSDELQGKPEQAKEKIVEGMLAKRFYAMQPGGVLGEQPWIHDSAKTVGQALSEAGARVVAFKRLSVAE